MSQELQSIREENARLRAALRPRIILPKRLGLLKKENMIVAFLYARSPNVCTRGMIMDAVYDNDADPPYESIVDVCICRARAKLKTFGVEILTHRGFGYFMPKESAEILRGMLEGEG